MDASTELESDHFPLSAELRLKLKLVPAHRVEDVMAGEPLYIFQRGVLGTDIVTPSVTGVFEPEATEVSIWMVGPPLSGTTFHYHASAFTGLAVGRKRWFLYPPTMTPPAGGSGPNAVPTFPITYWFSDVRTSFS